MIPEEVKRKIEAEFPVMYSDLDIHEYQRQAAEWGYLLAQDKIFALKQDLERLGREVEHQIKEKEQLLAEFDKLNKAHQVLAKKHDKLTMVNISHEYEKQISDLQLIEEMDKLKIAYHELAKKYDQLVMENMTHEYNNAEAKRFFPELIRQIKEEAVEEKDAQIKILVDTLAETVKQMAIMENNLTKEIVKLRPQINDVPPPTGVIENY